MKLETSQTPNSAPASTNGGQSGDSPAVDATLGRALFTQLVAQREPSQRTQTNSSQPSPAQSDPDNPPLPVDADQPGQDNLPPEQTSQDGAEETPAADESEDSLSQGGEDATSENAELESALEGLNEDARKHLMEMAKAVAEGKTSLGELKRGYKLTAQFEQKIEELQQQIEQLKGGNTQKAQLAPNQGAVPKSVADLKTVDEVQTRTQEARQAVRELQRFLRRNPDGGEVDGKPVTVDQIENAIAGWENELDALPLRAQQIQQQQAVQTQQKAVRQTLQAKLPQYFDPENAIGKRAQELIKTVPEIASAPNRDYIALALALGDEQLNKLLNPSPKTNGVSSAAKPVTRVTNGKVPLGKPHSAAGAIPPRTEGGIPVRTALEGVQKEGSRSSLATLIHATGR